jgi:[ribosomal protein S5]-alanine N-acetyltransferase
VLTDGPVRLRPLAMGDGPAWRELKDRNRAWLSRWEATVPPGDESGRINFRQMVRRLRAEALAARMLPFAIDYAEPVEGTESSGETAADPSITSFDDDVEVDDATGMARTRPHDAASASSGAKSAPAEAEPPHGVHLPHLAHRTRRAAAGPAYRLVGQLTVSTITWGSLRSANVGYWIDEAHAGRDITPTAVALAVDHCFRVCRLHRVEVCIRPENTPSLRVVEKLGFRPEGLRQRYLHIDGAWRDHATFALTEDEVPEGMLHRWHTLRSPLRGS